MTVSELVAMMRYAYGRRSLTISCDPDDEFTVHIACQYEDLGPVYRTLRSSTPGKFSDVLLDWKIAQTMKESETPPANAQVPPR